MAGLSEEISNVSKSEYATAALYAGMIGLVASDLIPTPADAAYFYMERNLRDRWKNGDISPQQYWKREAIIYYGLNPLWWILVGSIVIATKGDAKKKLYMLSGIIGGGAVIGVLAKNVKKDKAELEAELQDKKELEKYKNSL
jgi:hypothetical protein